MTPKRGRGRPKVPASILFHLWRMVRDEIAYRGAPNVAQACEAIVKRRPALRFVTQAPVAVRLLDITNPEKLRKKYAAAEARREIDPEFGAQCAAIEAQSAARWPDQQAAKAAGQALREGFAAVLFPSLHCSEIDAAASAAADKARTEAGDMPKPRRNRR